MSYQVTKQNYETGNEWHKEKSLGNVWTAELEKFLSYITVAEPKIVDIGCGGSGRDIKQFLERGAKVEGLDYSHAAIESVKKRFPEVSFYEADMTATGLPDASYDGLWACASLLNITKADAPKAIAEFARLLTGDGALFVSVKKGEGERMVSDKAGERFFSFWEEQELRNLIEAGGFKVQATDTREVLKAQTDGKPFSWLCLYANKNEKK
ncbi:class I SAM-dependent methyltransferase [Patescibacteria group bacterium]|nr:class I SAM-dependent methyltransferase [Patescibacteria group bacterium]